PPAAAMLTGGGLGPVCGVFASGVPTTVRETVASHVPGAGRRGQPASHFVDVTRLSAPQGAELSDYRDAISRAAGMLCAAAGVGRGTDVIDWPAATPAVAEAAAATGASVDAVTADGQQAEWLAGALDGVPGAGRIRVDETGDVLPRNRGRYRAVVSVERLELVGGTQRISFARAIDRLTDTGGRAGLQTVVATRKLPPAAVDSLAVLRSYIWPGFTLAEIDKLHALFDTATGLSCTKVVHLRDHYAQSLAFQQAEFTAGGRQAAAGGIDAVMRRLIVWQLSLKQALASLGLIEAVQMTLQRRRTRHS
ncbi:class I SAM-dependent methyltransferase, partial [Corynebacterium sp. CCM 8862]